MKKFGMFQCKFEQIGEFFGNFQDSYENNDWEKVKNNQKGKKMCKQATEKTRVFFLHTPPIGGVKSLFSYVEFWVSLEDIFFLSSPLGINQVIRIYSKTELNSGVDIW